MYIIVHFLCTQFLFTNRLTFTYTNNCHNKSFHLILSRANYWYIFIWEQSEHNIYNISSSRSFSQKLFGNFVCVSKVVFFFQIFFSNITPPLMYIRNYVFYTFYCIFCQFGCTDLGGRWMRHKTVYRQILSFKLLTKGINSVKLICVFTTSNKQTLNKGRLVCQGRCLIRVSNNSFHTSTINLWA